MFKILAAFMAIMFVLMMFQLFSSASVPTHPMEPDKIFRPDTGQ